MQSLPNEMLLEICSYLDYPDVLSFSRVNKDLQSLIMYEKYWEERCITKYKPKYLSWQGQYAKETTRRGKIFPGSENFQPILRCTQEAYKKEDNNLLTYFLRIFLKEKRMCYHAIPLRNSNLENYLISNLLRDSLMDDREETFLSILKEVEIKDRLSFYIIAKCRNLKRAQEKLIPTTYSLDWMIYAIQTKDYLLFSKLYPHTNEKGATHELLNIYSWPEVTPLLESCIDSKVTLNVKELQVNIYIPLPISLNADLEGVKGIMGYLSRYDHESVREMNTTYIELHDNIYYNYFKRDNLNGVQVSGIVSSFYDHIYYLTIPNFSS